MTTDHRTRKQLQLVIIGHGPQPQFRNLLDGMLENLFRLAGGTVKGIDVEVMRA